MYKIKSFTITPGDASDEAVNKWLEDNMDHIKIVTTTLSAAPDGEAGIYVIMYQDHRVKKAQPIGYQR